MRKCDSDPIHQVKHGEIVTLRAETAFGLISRGAYKPSQVPVPNTLS